MNPWEYQLEEEVTVKFPKGRELDGVIAARKRVAIGQMLIKTVNRYTVLYDDDKADTMIPPSWIHPRRQKSLLD